MHTSIPRGRKMVQSCGKRTPPCPDPLPLDIFLLSCDKYLLKICFATAAAVGAGNTVISIRSILQGADIQEDLLVATKCDLASFLSMKPKGHHLYPQNSCITVSLVFGCTFSSIPEIHMAVSSSWFISQQFTGFSLLPVCFIETVLFSSSSGISDMQS